VRSGGDGGVDDTPANLVAVEAVLERDFDLRLARSGHEAISMLLARPDVDVISMDLQMPGMDGFEAAAQIKKLPGCEDIPIVSSPPSTRKTRT
jgi:CheY-like chemotaxis protein